MRRALLAVLATLAVCAPAQASVGPTEPGSVVDSNSAGQGEAYRTTASESGPVDRLSVYLDGASTATRAEVGLYSDTGLDGAGTRLGACVIAEPIADAWNRCSLASAASVTSGTRYWLSILQPTGTPGVLKYRISTGSGAAYWSSQSSLAALPESWSSGTGWGAQTLSAYADLATVVDPDPTPTPTPTPSACLAADGCYPKPVNSGAGATGVPPGHTPAAACPTSPVSGAVITDCVSGGGTITTTGSGATYRFSEFRGQVTHQGSGTLTIEDSNFGPLSGCQNYDNTITGSNYTVRRGRFNTHVSEGPRDAGSNLLIEESFIGPMCSNPGDHADGIQGFGGGTNVVVRHNTIDLRTAQDVTSPIFFADNSQAGDVRDNLVAGGGYSIRLHDDFTPDRGPWVLIGNRIVTDSWTFGPMNNSGTTFTAATCSDNRLVGIDAAYNVTSVGSVVAC